MRTTNLFDGARAWWAERTTLEKAALAVAGSVGTAIAVATVAAPGLLTTTVGGGLAAAGAWFLKTGMRT
jgi:hypothetical protein